VIRGVTPTEFQRSTYPAQFHKQLDVIHEGVSTGIPIPRCIEDK